jgi:hypothetical protein
VHEKTRKPYWMHTYYFTVNPFNFASYNVLMHAFYNQTLYHFPHAPTPVENHKVIAGMFYISTTIHASINVLLAF